MTAPVFGLRQWDAVVALRNAGLPSQAMTLQRARQPKLVLALALDVMGDEVLPATAEATLDDLRRATEAHLAAIRTQPLAELRAARYPRSRWTTCPDCEGMGVARGHGYDGCRTCGGRRQVAA